MYKSYKVEMAPTERQKRMFNRDFKAGLMVHNLYLNKALEQIETYGKYGDYEKFLEWFYRKYLRNSENRKNFVDGFNRIAIRRICMTLDRNLAKFMAGEIGEPKVKKLKTGKVSLYVANLVKKREFIQVEESEIYLPGYGWIRLKEKGYIPVKAENTKIVNAFISKDVDRFFVSVSIESFNEVISNNNMSGEKLNEKPIGIDLGLINYATLSDGRVFPNINKTRKVENLEKRAMRLQRAQQRKLEMYNVETLADSRGEEEEKVSANYEKNKVKLLKTNRRLRNIRGNYLNKMIAEIVRTNPKYVAIEDLNISGLLKKGRISRAIQHAMFREFRERLVKKCSARGIEVRIVNRYYPSSKMCHNCGRINRELTLDERIFRCACGYSEDRDYNASLNIRDSRDYEIGKLN